MESILTTIKKLLGIEEDYTHFDVDIIIHINSALMTLRQLGVGSGKSMSISNASDTWDMTIGDTKEIESIKSYIYMKVRMAFDPPSSSFVLDAMNRTATELEWRINSQIEFDKED